MQPYLVLIPDLQQPIQHGLVPAAVDIGDGRHLLAELLFPRTLLSIVKAVASHIFPPEHVPFRVSLGSRGIGIVVEAEIVGRCRLTFRLPGPVPGIGRSVLRLGEPGAEAEPARGPGCSGEQRHQHRRDQQDPPQPARPALFPAQVTQACTGVFNVSALRPVQSAEQLFRYAHSPSSCSIRCSFFRVLWSIPAVLLWLKPSFSAISATGVRYQ